MIVIHGSWFPSHFIDSDPVFFIWGETDNHDLAYGRRGRPPSGDPPYTWHPLQIDIDRARAAFLSLTGTDTGELPSGRRRLALLLPSDETGPVPSPVLREQSKIPEDHRFSLDAWEIGGAVAASASCVIPLTRLQQRFLEDEEVFVAGDDLIFWSWSAKSVLQILARGLFVPSVTRDNHHKPGYRAAWEPLWSHTELRGAVTRLADAMPSACRCLFPRPRLGKIDPLPAAELLKDFLALGTDQLVRRWLLEESPGVRGGMASSTSSFATGSKWTGGLTGNDPALNLSEDQAEALQAEVTAWLAPVLGDQDDTFRLCFRLDPPGEDGTGEHDQDRAGVNGKDEEAEDQDNGVKDIKDNVWMLRFFLQSLDDPSLLIPAARIWESTTDRMLITRYVIDNPQEVLLASLGRACRLFEPLQEALEESRPEACALTTRQAYTFLTDTARILQESGFGVLIPPWWTDPNQKLGIKLKVKGSNRSEASAGFGLTSLVEFNWELALGNQEITRQEFKAIAGLKVPLVRLRGRWVRFDPEKIKAAIKFWESTNQQDQLTAAEAMHLAARVESEDSEEGIVDVEFSGWLEKLRRRITKDTVELRPVQSPDGLRGKLRPYQVQGLSWLVFMRDLHLGACLADDMGLGKTIQVLALLQHDRETGRHNRPCLLVCPTSVTSNWVAEAGRFTPGLRTYIHHGPDRQQQPEEFIDICANHDLIITTYDLAHRDSDLLSEVEWEAVILDEAQNIKNHMTKRSRAIRSLPAEYRLALTGTPIENRLTELWSIMEFLNPGYLGSFEHFRRRLARPVERYNDQRAANQLRHLVRPFILRRVKSNPDIIKDLPEKQETNVYCYLTREQATLYEAVVEDMVEKIENSEGMQRRGLVLSTITKLKQICDHPALFLKEQGNLSGRSGKLARLTEILDEILAEEDSALIFTQYARMGRLLRTYLRNRFDTRIFFLHGATPASDRQKMIDEFQSDNTGGRIFILSVKAGGVGLNLTTANHVFHYDRWWNPAVENQATDRAFRIGQKRNVQVHKFICRGTLEERINELIEAKKDLADSIVTPGQKWLTEMSTRQLRETIDLRQDAFDYDSDIDVNVDYEAYS